MQGDIVAQGLELMLFGMGTVVVFLALLVAMATAGMSRLRQAATFRSRCPAPPRAGRPAAACADRQAAGR